MKSMLVLIASPALEEPLIDWLLMRTDISGFSSHTGFGHGSGHVLSVAEQVAGRRNQILFWIELEQDKTVDVLASLNTDFSGSHIHYWQLPIVDSGLIE